MIKKFIWISLLAILIAGSKASCSKASVHEKKPTRPSLRADPRRLVNPLSPAQKAEEGTSGECRKSRPDADWAGS